jgi:hypothetical protein
MIGDDRVDKGEIPRATLVRSMRGASLRSGVLLFLLLTASLAGCVDDGAASRAALTAASTASSAAVPNVTAELGSIHGIVVDDEQTPIQGAQVSLLEKLVEVTTDATGAYTINDLEPGGYRLVVTRVGYSQGARKVDVLAAEITKADFVLNALDILDPYQLVLSKVAYLKATWIYVTHAQGPLVNNSGFNSLTCDPCIFTQYHAKNATQVMTETLWRSGQSGLPVLNNQVWLNYGINPTAEKHMGDIIRTGYWKNRQAVLWTDGQVKSLASVDLSVLWVEGDLLSVNVEHKVEVFTSLAYDGPFPDKYSALPPA